MLERTRLHVTGMNSAEAIRKVSDALVGVQGVADIGVNDEEALVEVKYDPDKTDKSAIKAAISRTGCVVNE